MLVDPVRSIHSYLSSHSVDDPGSIEINVLVHAQLSGGEILENFHRQSFEYINFHQRGEMFGALAMEVGKFFPEFQ